ncbi:MAG: aminotransferase class III-fold pyridoxal phosphate-dependent enzyme [Chloroflexi bacterium]|nr:aminotransferase class III-fold pyridoxal phosphate-dependent enzyme [Chloroflexota bacterium]
MPYIQLKTSIPGPKSQELLARRAAAVSAALYQSVPIAYARASGSLVEDVDGNILLDLVGGIGALAVGHAPAPVIEAIQAQAEKYLHVCPIVANYEPYIAVCEQLNAITPGDFPKKTLLANGGAEAVENAVKLARAYTKRAAIICFEGGYHGRTNLTMSLTSKYSLFKKGFGPFAPEIYRLPLPNLYRTPPGMSQEDYLNWSLWNLENALVAQVDPSAIAAILIEPIIGEGGFIPVPALFLQKIREICDRHGIVMIADEIQCGFGRSGKLFAIEHTGVVPDLILTAKSLAAGTPLSAVTGRAEILDAPHLGGVGSTYGGNPLACVAALEAIKLINRSETLANATRIEGTVRSTFEPLKTEIPVLGDVRGRGAMMALEFVKDPVSKEPWPEFVLNVIQKCIAKGVLLLRAGLYSNCIRLLPQLDIPEEQLQEGLGVMATSIVDTYGEMR